MSVDLAKIEEALAAARDKKENLRDQLNACMGFIQACEMLLVEADKGVMPHAGANAPETQRAVTGDHRAVETSDRKREVKLDGAA